MAGGGDGPVNWELARQVGVATAAEAGPDPAPTDADREGLEAAVRLAELQVASATGLEPPARLATVRAVRRAEWVADQTAALRGLDRAGGARMGEALSQAIDRAAAAEGAPAGWAGSLAQLGPLLQGSQVGQVLGDLATQAFAGHDVAVPRAEEDDLSSSSRTWPRSSATGRSTRRSSGPRWRCTRWSTAPTFSRAVGPPRTRSVWSTTSSPRCGSTWRG